MSNMFGEHITPIEIFRNYIYPQIKEYLYDFYWFDMFAGEGNLILPILEHIPVQERIEYFKENIFLTDIQSKMVEKMIQNAKKYGIPEEIARKKIRAKNSFVCPWYGFSQKKMPFHITNPPYLCLSHIKKKNIEKYLTYFKMPEFRGYQDLYQIALAREILYQKTNSPDLCIYILPLNFLYGGKASEKIRNDFFKLFKIKNCILFETKIFPNTGSNTGLFLFETKKTRVIEDFSFPSIIVDQNKDVYTKYMTLRHKYNYRCGTEFYDFINNYYIEDDDKRIRYNVNRVYLKNINKEEGIINLDVINVNKFIKNKYQKINIKVSKKTAALLTNNKLFIRTIDTHDLKNKPLGIYKIKDILGSDGIVNSKEAYRTNPIQIFFDSPIEQDIIMKYVNLVLKKTRELTNSSYLTTYKYDSTGIVRKYIGLNQIKSIIDTCPIYMLNKREKNIFENILNNQSFYRLKEFLNVLKRCK